MSKTECRQAFKALLLEVHKHIFAAAGLVSLFTMMKIENPLNFD